MINMMDASCSSISSYLLRGDEDSTKDPASRTRYFNIWFEGDVGSLIVDDSKIWFVPRHYRQLRRGVKSTFVSWGWKKVDFVEALHPRSNKSRRLGRLELILKTDSYNNVVAFGMENDILNRIAEDINDRLVKRAHASESLSALGGEDDEDY